MGAWKYQIYFSCMLNMISHSFAALTREISCSTLEINLVFPRPHACIILYIVTQEAILKACAYKKHCNIISEQAENSFISEI
jgi:hypothetical protein